MSQSGHVTFDHDKGQAFFNFGVPCPLDFGECSPADFYPFSLGFLCSLVRKPPELWRKLPDCRAEKSVESCQASLFFCHRSFGPELGFPERGVLTPTKGLDTSGEVMGNF